MIEQGKPPACRMCESARRGGAVTRRFSLALAVAGCAPAAPVFPVHRVDVTLSSVTPSVELVDDDRHLWRFSLAPGGWGCATGAAPGWLAPWLLLAVRRRRSAGARSPG